MERFISTEVINSKVKNRQPGNLALCTAHSDSSMQESSGCGPPLSQLHISIFLHVRGQIDLNYTLKQSTPNTSFNDFYLQ